MLTVTGGHLGFIGSKGGRGVGVGVYGGGRREASKRAACQTVPAPNSGVWAIRSSTQMPLGRFTHYNLSAQRNGQFTRYNFLRISLPKEIRQ